MSYSRVMLMAAFVLGAATLVSAQPKVLVDEFGKAEGDVTLLGMLPDPTDGYLGGPVLVYQLPFPVLPGELRVMDPDGMLGDVIRFTNNLTNNSQMVFYSDGTNEAHPGGLADIPIPLEQLYPYPFPITYREEIGTEANNYVLYVPAAAEPGSFPTGAVGVEYTFVSDTPEPATLSLLALGGLGALLRRKRR